MMEVYITACWIQPQNIILPKSFTSEIKNPYLQVNYKPTPMAKSQDAKKDVKKKPAKTPKEKAAAKLDKKKNKYD